MVEMLLRRECTVGQLAEGCDIRSHVASEHLRRMKDRGLLACRRDGRRIYYRVADEGLSGILDCVKKRLRARGRLIPRCR
jgi:DNA-binding transcriptional ArsR family regulator